MYVFHHGRTVPAYLTIGQGEMLLPFFRAAAFCISITHGEKMIAAEGHKPDINELTELAKEAGFTFAAPLAMGSLEFREEVREMCSSDRCRSFGKSWSCPPAAGDLAVIRKRAERFRSGIVVQTCGDIQSSFDTAAMHAIMKAHKKNFDTLVRQIRFFYPECLPMGAGACTACRTCTYPDRPCRHPERMYISMEAYGLLVSDVAESSGLHYNYGDNKMTFTSCILTD